MYPASARPVAMPTMFCSATPTLKNRSREAVGERLEGHVAEVARQQQDPLVVLGELDSVRMNAFRTLSAVTSSRACRYSSSDIGM